VVGTAFCRQRCRVGLRASWTVCHTEKPRVRDCNRTTSSQLSSQQPSY